MNFNWGEHSLRFDLFNGTVMSSSKWSETHVSSSGGGGYLHQGSGHVSAPTITSTVKAKHEFWIQTQDGQQIAVQLTDADFPLMTGQLITLVSSPSTKKPNDYRWVFVRNQSAKQAWILNAATAAAAAEMHPFRLWSMGTAIGLTVLGLFAWAPLAVAGIGYGGYRLFRRYQDQKAIIAALEAHMKQITPVLAAPTANAA